MLSRSVIMPKHLAPLRL